LKSLHILLKWKLKNKINHNQNNKAPLKKQKRGTELILNMYKFNILIKITLHHFKFLLKRGCAAAGYYCGRTGYYYYGLGYGYST
jgi:hypothetical protein